MVTDNRDAYRAGISGARSYPGNPDSFRRGQKSAKEFRRNQRYKNPSNKRYASNRPSKLEQGIKKLGRDFGTMTKDFGNAGKTGVSSIYDAVAKFGKYIGDTQARAKQNKKILGDAYSDEAKMSLMTGFGLREGQEGYEGSDQAFYNKYRKLGDMLSGKEAEEKYKIADSAFNNAQISSRMNYGLGQLGEDTLFKKGYDSYRNPMGDEISPRFNMENFMGGLDATPAGKAFMAEANKAIDRESGNSLIGNEMKSFGSPRATFTSPSEINRQINSNAVLSEDILPTLPISNQPNIDDYNQIISPPFNAADIYNNLNLQGVKNKIFPGMNLEDITQEDLNNLSLEDKLYLGYTG